MQRWICIAESEEEDEEEYAKSEEEEEYAKSEKEEEYAIAKRKRNMQ